MSSNHWHRKYGPYHTIGLQKIRGHSSLHPKTIFVPEGYHGAQQIYQVNRIHLQHRASLISTPTSVVERALSENKLSKILSCKSWLRISFSLRTCNIEVDPKLVVRFIPDLKVAITLVCVMIEGNIPSSIRLLTTLAKLGATQCTIELIIFNFHRFKNCQNVHPYDTP